MTSLLPFRRREEERAVDIPLTAREIHGNLVLTGSWVTAWFLATPVQWPFKLDEDRQSWMLSAAAQYAQLAGYRVTERVTSRPYPISQWATNLNARTPHPAELDGEDAWPEYLVRRQKAMWGQELAEKEVYIGVRFAQRDNLAMVLDRVRGRAGSGETDRIGREADHIATLLRGGALNARPLTGEETQWLMHRSVSIGLSVPYDRSTSGVQSWQDDDLAAITDGVYYTDTRLGRTVQVTSRRADRVETQHVAVVTLSSMGPANAPELNRAEWLYALDSLPFPVERVSTFDVLGVDATRKHVRSSLLAIRDQQKHYRQHDQDVPDDLAAKATLAKRIDADLTDGKPALAVRMVGFHRLAVAGDTEEQAMTRVRAITNLYRNRIDVHLPVSPFEVLREFVPGEPIRRPTHLRRYSALYHAAGAALANGDVGDRVGDWLGILDGSVQRPVMFDPWLAPEVMDSPGMYPVVGTLGAGKSALIAKILDSALHRGVRSVVFDPSVTFAGMAEMPRWKKHARVVDLHDAQPGVLNPFALVPQPNPADYTDPKAFEDAQIIARAERNQLVLDVCQRLIPPQYRRGQETDQLVRDAVRTVSDFPSPSLLDVVTHLRESPVPQGAVLARILEDVKDMTVEGKLLFPSGTASVVLGDDLLTVITVGGLQLPPTGSDEESWTAAERVAVPVLALATAFASRLVYAGNRHRRKMLVLDEMHVLAEWSSGRALFKRLARDSRKWNVAVLAAGQNPSDALDLDVQNLIGGAFVGRIADDQTAADALRLLRIETGVNYEEVVRGLSPHDRRDDYRQFLMLDVFGRVGIIQVTFDDDPELLEAINTRPREQE